jgi:5'-nucleotidase
LPPDTVLNVNVPDRPYAEIRGVAVTKMGRRDYQDEIVVRKDPRGALYYWIGGAEPSHVTAPGTDFEAIEQDCISVTPLHRDITNHAALQTLEAWSLAP